MDAQHVIYLGNRKEIIDFSNFKETLSNEIKRLQKEQSSSQISLVLSLDKQVEYGPFLHLFSLAQECGLPIRLVYQTPDNERG